MKRMSAVDQIKSMQLEKLGGFDFCNVNAMNTDMVPAERPNNLVAEAENIVSIAPIEGLRADAGELFPAIEAAYKKHVVISALQDVEKGKIYEELFQAVSIQGSKDSLYQQTLRIMDVSVTTAKRCRDIYGLWKMTGTEIGKKIIASLPARAVDSMKRIGFDTVSDYLSDPQSSREEFLDFLQREGAARRAQIENKEHNTEKSPDVDDIEVLDSLAQYNGEPQDKDLQFDPDHPIFDPSGEPAKIVSTSDDLFKKLTKVAVRLGAETSQDPYVWKKVIQKDPEQAETLLFYLEEALTTLTALESAE
jgi:hypothetical protein